MDYRRYILGRAQAGDLEALQPVTLANYLHALVTDGYLVVVPAPGPLDMATLMARGPFAVQSITSATLTPAGEALLTSLGG